MNEISNFKFKQVDVFSNISCKGNPVCVFLNSEGLSTEQMQKIARWTNLSETTFLDTSKKADFRARIFTPSEELPFAGHPTLGSAWAYFEAQNLQNGRLKQECQFGIINVQKTKQGIFLFLSSYRILIDSS